MVDIKPKITQEVSMRNEHTQAVANTLAEADAIEIVDPTTKSMAESLRKRAQKMRTTIDKGRKSHTEPYRQYVDKVNKVAATFIDPLKAAEKKIKDKLIERDNKVEAERQAKEKLVQGCLERIHAATNQSELEDAIASVTSDDPRIMEAVTRKNAAREQERLDEEIRQDKEKADAHIARIREEQGDEAARREEIRLGIEIDKKEIQKSEAKVASHQEIEQAKIDTDNARRSSFIQKKQNKVKGLGMETKFEITDPNLVPRMFCEPCTKKIRKAIEEYGKELEIPGVKIREQKRIR